jgi:resuscitation-promoting factor RpfA
MTKPCRWHRAGVVVVIFATAALALMNTGTAMASADVNWDAVARCESGGNWAASTGNGFLGGLQFLPSTWRAYGGTGSPATASREQQIAIAEKVARGPQGLAAWPVCGRHAFDGGGGTSRNTRAALPAMAPAAHPPARASSHRQHACRHRCCVLKWRKV